MKALRQIVCDLQSEIIKAEKPSKTYEGTLRNRWVRRRFATIAKRIERAINEIKERPNDV